MDKFSSSVSCLKLSAIKRMTILGQKHSDPIFLSWGRPYGSTPEIVNKYVIDKLNNDSEIGKYTVPQGYSLLRETISKFHLEHRGYKADSDRQILVTAGAMEAMFIIMQALLDVEDEVIMTDPGFTSYRQHIALAKGKIRYLPLLEENGWNPDLSKMEELISSKTKAIIITSPNNPTGTIYSKEAIKQMVKVAEKYGIYVISDEIYDHLVYDGNEYFVPSMMQEQYDKIISVYSLSKRYHMTGWRIGYIIASPEVVENLNKVHDAATICACSVAQRAAVAALQNDKNIVPEIKKVYDENRELICKELDTLKNVFEYVKPSGAYYIFPKIKVPYKSTEDFAVDLIENTGVTTVPGDAFGPSGAGHLRMAFCIKKGKTKEAFKRMRSYFA